MKIMHLWVPEDQGKWGQPRVIELDSKPPQPGTVYAVTGSGAHDARSKFAQSQQAEPDQETDPAAWGSWKAAANLVKEVKVYA